MPEIEGTEGEPRTKIAGDNTESTGPVKYAEGPLPVAPGELVPEAVLHPSEPALPPPVAAPPDPDPEPEPEPEDHDEHPHHAAAVHQRHKRSSKR
jgi:hypothetical protein